ncbi:MAG: right-handed parallel beta-helix repeat-containing protein [Christensenellales bacterium]|jgi:hypothetical protein
MDYYLDSRTGSDGNDGLTPQAPWRSIERAHRRRYEPGDRIFFRRGGSWTGMFSPAGSGSKEAPITIDAYDEGDPPCIDGACAQAAIRLDRVDHWTVRNLKCINRANERFPRCGILVMGRPVGITRGIRIEGCEITEVTGENRRQMPFYRNMYWNSGIYVTFPHKCTQENHLDDIVIENNYVHDVLTSGIRVNQDEDVQKDIFHTNVVVRGNRIERTGCDGIIVANCVAPLIEYNRCFDAGALGSLEDTYLIAGVWVCATSDATIQYNEVARTRLFSNDGTAFDTDWGVAGVTTFQYNYTHENEGGFWLDCTAFKHNPACRGTILRGNVSVNDHRCIVQADTGIETLFEGNTFINTDDSLEICTHADGKSHRYVNNSFCLEKLPVLGWQASRYEANAYAQGLVNEKDLLPKICDCSLLDKARQLSNLDEQEEVFGLCFERPTRKEDAL